MLIYRYYSPPSSQADEIAADVRRFADKIVGGDRHGEQRAKQMAMAVANKAAQERVAAHRRQLQEDNQRGREEARERKREADRKRRARDAEKVERAHVKAQEKAAKAVSDARAQGERRRAQADERALAMRAKIDADKKQWREEQKTNRAANKAAGKYVFRFFARV